MDKSNIADRFTKVNDQLIGLGLPPRLVMLYGRLVFDRRKTGRCFRKWETLAKEIGLKSPVTVYRLLLQLKALRLVKWKRYGRYCNEYEPLPPDIAFLQCQTLHGRNVSNVARTQPRKESSSKEKERRERAQPSRKPETSHHAPPAGKTQNAGSPKKSNDDENPKPQPQSPEEELRQRLRDRHGPLFDIDRCVEHVRKQLDKAGVPVAEFVSYDATNTTAPDALQNPTGHYVQLAKTLRHAAVAAAHEAVLEPLRRAAANAPPEPPRDSRGLCAKCHGPGVLADGTYCSCAMGRDLEGLARRDKAQPPKKAPTEAKKILDFPTKGA